VRTRIVESGRNRQPRYGPGTEPEVPISAAAAQIAQLVRTGMDPRDVARRVLSAIRGGDLYVFTHPQLRDAVEDRLRGILAAFDKAAAE